MTELDSTNIPPGYCQCGCGGKTRVWPHNDAHQGRVKGQSSRFVSGHNRVLRPHSPSLIQGHRQRWLEQAPDIPYGYCQCGCGNKTTLSRCTSANLGRVSGLPNRYVTGHAIKGKALPQRRRFTNEQELGICYRYQAGESSLAIAKELGITWGQVGAMLRRHEFQLRAHPYRGNARWTEVQQGVRRVPIYQEWRSAVLTRDKHICQSCGKQPRGKNAIHVHHIRSVAVIVAEYNLKSLEDIYSCKELWETGNGITLCAHCHWETHRA